ncbi:MAG: hypothetical protein BIFFINMI_02701 [Phycisphaerae bacterium]|nr:hypothetical protein [Phycisphaerae bacterium]
MTDRAIPHWLSEFAHRLAGLIRKHNGVPVFRENLEGWTGYMEAQMQGAAA